jgi:2C-methyl-D-erythritol 2,4-cyclodiphosphate synthase
MLRVGFGYDMHQLQNGADLAKWLDQLLMRSAMNTKTK